MWYKSMVCLLGNLASRWHAIGTSNWLAKGWRIEVDVVQNDRLSLGDFAPGHWLKEGGGL